MITMRRQKCIYGTLLVLGIAIAIMAIILPLTVTTRDEINERGTCRSRATYIARLLVHYAKVKGRFPSGQSTSGGAGPTWLSEVRSLLAAEHRPFDSWALKCSTDRSGAFTSYFMDSAVQGRLFKSIPEQQYDSVPVVVERRGAGSHSTVVYLSGRVTQTK